MTFSVGILYSVQTFLKFVNETPLKTTEFSSLFQNFQATSSTIILSVAEECNWITLDVSGNVKVSRHGNEILSETCMRDALRIQLKHLIEKYRPSWSFLIHKGRKEAFQYFPSDVKQCFKEADLIDSFDPTVIEWWDRLAAIARGIQKDTLLDIGRMGEALSIKYERNRTGEEPVWQAIESNLSGFDILSRVSSFELTPLRIEVKATTLTSSFGFYLTKNEWSVAENSQNYFFHLWVLDKEPKLFILDKSDVSSHIPINQGYGVWENVKITFDMETLNRIKRNDQ